MLLFLTDFDFYVDGSSDILIQSAAGLDVPVAIYDDYLAGEPIENFTITAKPPRYGGAPFLFRDSVVNIIDADGKWVLWARGSEPICRDDPISRWRLQSMY